jgi:pimeloyl-ACP methyl ester carboxylesterase
VAGAFFLERDGVRLAGVDFGGAGPAVVLLHGLAGYAGEWTQTASWLTERHHVVALDARGHGDSEREPADVSPSAHVADVLFALERLDLAPAALVGQSLGGRTALLAAAKRPDLVRAVVVAEAGPGGGAAEADEAAGEIRAALARWPMPFASRAAAVEFLGGPSLHADAFAGGLEERDGAWWPRYEPQVLVRTLRESFAEPCWEACDAVACPALVVRAGKGSLSAQDAEAMRRRLAAGRLVVLEDAGHDLHLERPGEWRAALEGFLNEG